MQRGITVEEAVKAMNSFVAIEKRRNNGIGRTGKAKLFRGSTFINLVRIETSTFVFLARIDNDERGVLASQCSGIVQSSFQLAGHRFIACEVEMNIVKSGSNHGGVVTTLDKYDEVSVVSKLNNVDSETLQNIYSDQSFRFFRPRSFSVALVEE